jgi:hypothetical protein
METPMALDASPKLSPVAVPELIWFQVISPAGTTPTSWPGLTVSDPEVIALGPKSSRSDAAGDVTAAAKKRAEKVADNGFMVSIYGFRFKD